MQSKIIFENNCELIINSKITKFCKNLKSILEYMPEENDIKCINYSSLIDNVDENIGKVFLTTYFEMENIEDDIIRNKCEKDLVSSFNEKGQLKEILDCAQSLGSESLINKIKIELKNNMENDILQIKEGKQATGYFKDWFLSEKPTMKNVPRIIDEDDF